jgi:hypothetical protein
VTGIQAAVNNAGIVQAQSGFLSLDAGGASTGVFKAIAGTTNNFGGLVHTLLAGTRFEGAGLFELAQNYTGAGLSIATPITITNRFLLHNGGTLQGTNIITFTGSFDWIGGNMTENGTTTFASSATVNFSSGNTKVWRARTINNQANVSYSGGGWYGDLSGIWNNQANGTLNFTSDVGLAFYGAGNYCVFNNAGDIRKSGGNGVTGIQAAVNNTGIVQALSGFLSLDAGGASTGVFRASAGATNNFGGLVHTLLAGTRFEGAGLFELAQNYTGAGLSIATPITITNRFLLHNGGTLQGTNIITFTGPFDWLGGNMEGSGTTTFASSATVNFSSGNT